MSLVRVWLVTLCMIGWGALGAQAADTAIVKGRVVLPPDSGSPQDTIIYLEGHIGTPTPNTATLDQRDQTFVPHVLAVVQGGTVQFLNSDPLFHSVFAASSAKHFDLGMFGRGERRSVQFDKPGLVELRCNVHPSMRAYILVVENNYFTAPDKEGNFQIRAIPPGRYKLRAWHEGFPVAETWANLDDASLRTVELRLQK
ncbi:MAG: carboxypeptidase regulatory-like domain-containing protein [Candidatus Binatia bacterium]